ncbi:hypothetical protein CABS01_00412 [Colletotrichum abscissum]|uniref:uncharacterized protein n=1 Tax=Colletotrichum abscissum TaxID=1671311 RepID=UPI0027D4A279|nr:uncharacterized protein CABS01_00412 [Colletotrichum abscissum]KAK1525323.1 hypothetical protein CABS01_00412 [Colletotrichum abscissum]
MGYQQSSFFSLSLSLCFYSLSHCFHVVGFFFLFPSFSLVLSFLRLTDKILLAPSILKIQLRMGIDPEFRSWHQRNELSNKLAVIAWDLLHLHSTARACCCCCWNSCPVPASGLVVLFPESFRCVPAMPAVVVLIGRLVVWCKTVSEVR